MNQKVRVGYIVLLYETIDRMRQADWLKSEFTAGDLLMLDRHSYVHIY